MKNFKLLNIIEILKAESLRSPIQCNHASAIMIGSEIVSLGVNEFETIINSEFVPSVHSEVRAILQARKKLNMNKKKLFVSRSTRDWVLKQSRFKGGKGNHDFDPDNSIWKAPKLLSV